MNVKLVVGFCMIIGVTGCMKRPQLTDSAKNVQVLMKSEPTSGCEELADVSTGNDWLSDVEDVKKYLRNAAAELGANVLTVDVLEKEQFGSGNPVYKGSGRAFLCK